MKTEITDIIFDLGGVLIDWNPEYLFLKEFNNDLKKMNWFLDNICTMDWNENQDAGYPIAQATEDLVEKHPDFENLIRMYYGRWEEMLGGAFHETVAIFEKLLPNFNVVALTNWSSETFPIAQKRFEFLKRFKGIVVSAEEKTRKPYKEIYEICLNRFNIIPEKSIFIDDNLRNIKAANELGINGIHYKNAAQLIEDLKKYDINS